MGLNDLMHPRNRYKDSPPNFSELGAIYPEFKKFTRENSSGTVSINFKDPEALRAVTCCTLDHDFGLKLDLPLDRLIPTVPLRLNYILWLEDLMKSLGEVAEAVWGLDIGTGASCIYPLLGAAIDNWNFIATEIDEFALGYAQRNVAQNGMDGKIKLKLVSPDSYLRKPLKDVTQKITFCMCNPPFFSCEEEAMFGASRTDKRPLPTSVCTGSANETVTRGGEVEFVKGIIRDSMEMKDMISWYTTMLGKKSSLTEVMAFLKKNKIYAVTTTEFCQGKTRRWGVAWTFIKGILSIEIDIKETSHKTTDSISFTCTAVENTWSNQRRKRREQQRQKPLISDDVPPAAIEDADQRSTSAAGSTPTAIDLSQTGKKSITDTCALTKRENSTDKTAEGPMNGSQVSGSTTNSDGKPESDMALKDRGVNQNCSSPLCVFSVNVGEKIGEGQEIVCISVEFVDGKDKNQLYQIYQYLQNKLLKGL
ncbi:RNA N6-adenosine-methyltransferase METTL16 isoform X2 [Nematostella vectensis]|uniref:RNA N6-adenosine-methyltransferase METTL16 isoform X2 n=1 Tax=Nematostella vectensis TaxID=45351 RepID=UPI002076EC03|nr:RNA N6-adenosine-methyltransferase METTL16 isoform X2 [Nematostella vectensis]